MNNYAVDIQKLYIAYFQRPADPAGLAFWESQVATFGIGVVSNAFGASAEYKGLYNGKTSTEMVNAIYMNLFGRGAESAGLKYWAELLAAGTLSVDNIVSDVIGSARNDDELTVGNKVAAAIQFTAGLDTPAEQAAYSSAAATDIARTWLASVGSSSESLTNAAGTLDATILKMVGGGPKDTGGGGSSGPAPALTFTLTTGIDKFTGAARDDVFIAGHDTMSASDVLNGGGGHDVLLITANQQNLTVRPTSIEEVRLNDGHTLYATAVDLGPSAFGTFAFGHSATTNTGDVTLSIDSVSETANLSGITAGQAGTSTSRIKAVYTNGPTGQLDITLTGLDDIFTGTTYSDTINGGAGADTLNGGDGNDNFVGFLGADFIDGGAGLADTLLLNATSTDLNAATDAQIVSVEMVSLTSATAGVVLNLSAQSEGFYISGSQHGDIIYGGKGADNISGGNGDDTFVGFEGADQLEGGAGTNTLRLTATSADLNVAGNSKLQDIQNIDAATAAAGVTITLTAQTEALNITGSAHNDTLTGGSGSDVLIGGEGDDVLTGGGGADDLTGGDGADTFVFTSVSGGSDTIQDFGVGGADKLRFEGSDFYGIAPTHIKIITGEAQYNGGSDYGMDGGAYLVYMAGSGQLIYDDNGNDTSGGFTILATVRTTGGAAATLQESDFLLPLV
jgi:Ca2+-binding RTX toxin-like protein